MRDARCEIQERSQPTRMQAINQSTNTAMQEEQETPPHHPTYNVRLSEEQIIAIMSQVFPGRQMRSCELLSHGKSFNNRIYFLDMGPESSPKSNGPTQFALEVCGHYFGATKVQNEVGALLFLKRHCPTVPVPEIVAWSETGQAIAISQYGRSHEAAKLSNSTNSGEPAAFQSEHGWLLQTRLPGRTLTLHDLEQPYGYSLLQQLAAHVATWRTIIPAPSHVIGNLRFAKPGESEQSENTRLVLGSATALVVGGLILTHKYTKAPLNSWAEYYNYQLHDQYEHLINTPVLSGLACEIANEISTFLPMLPSLPFLSGTSIKFSHMDFSPRNILISNSNDGEDPKVTGILDFEFAAFLPAPVEFLNSLTNQPDDWPLHHYKTMLSELRAIEHSNAAASTDHCSIEVPNVELPDAPCPDRERCLCPGHVFQHLSTLETVIASTAPWWITSTSHIGKEDKLASDCESAADVVLDGLRKLKPLLVAST